MHHLREKKISTEQTWIVVEASPGNWKTNKTRQDRQAKRIVFMGSGPMLICHDSSDTDTDKDKIHITNPLSEALISVKNITLLHQYHPIPSSLLTHNFINYKYHRFCAFPVKDRLFSSHYYNSNRKIESTHDTVACKCRNFNTPGLFSACWR